MADDPTYLIGAYGSKFEMLPDGRLTRTEACNARDPRSGEPCSLDVGHAPGHSWERPISVLSSIYPS